MADAPLQLHVTLLLTYFLNHRNLILGKLPSEGSPHPLYLLDDGMLLNLLAGHVGGPAVAEPRFRYRDRRGIIIYKAGWLRVGSYSWNSAGEANWICLDFDGANHQTHLVDPQQAVLKAAFHCCDLGVPFYLERSGGGLGFHLWVFLEAPVPADKAWTVGLFLVPPYLRLNTGGYADAGDGTGVEVFPKFGDAGRVTPIGLGCPIWLPYWHGAKPGGNLFYRVHDGGLMQYEPEGFDRLSIEHMEELLAERRAWAEKREDEAEAMPGPCTPGTSQPMPGGDTRDGALATWLRHVARTIRLQDVYGKYLTGRNSSPGWLECRDPGSQSGDYHPSAGVADGTGMASRGTFHSFRTRKTMNIPEFMVYSSQAATLDEAYEKLTALTGIPRPSWHEPNRYSNQ